MKRRRGTAAEADLMAMRLRRENMVASHKAVMEEYKVREMIKASEMNPARPQLVITFKLVNHLLFGIFDFGFRDLGFLIFHFWILGFRSFGFWIL
jgi:hypothetical protein